jgi:hypothetical protein
MASLSVRNRECQIFGRETMSVVRRQVDHVLGLENELAAGAEATPDFFTYTRDRGQEIEDAIQSAGDAKGRESGQTADAILAWENCSHFLGHHS